MTIHENFLAGLGFEHRVQGRLIERGWYSVRWALLDYAQTLKPRWLGTPVGFLPDVFTWRGADAVFIDAKASEPRAWLNVQTEEHDFQVRFAQLMRMPLYYVFGRGETIPIDTFGAHAEPGTPTGNGSGTPFLRCDPIHATPFAEVFA